MSRWNTRNRRRNTSAECGRIRAGGGLHNRGRTRFRSGAANLCGFQSARLRLCISPQPVQHDGSWPVCRHASRLPAHSKRRADIALRGITKDICRGSEAGLAGSRRRGPANPLLKRNVARRGPTGLSERRKLLQESNRERRACSADRSKRRQTTSAISCRTGARLCRSHKDSGGMAHRAGRIRKGATRWEPRAFQHSTLWRL